MLPAVAVLEQHCMVECQADGPAHGNTNDRCSYLHNLCACMYIEAKLATFLCLSLVTANKSDCTEYTPA